MNTKAIKTWAKEIIDFFKDEKNKSYTCWYELGKDNKGNVLAIVAGYPDGLDFPYMYFGYKASNSVMSEYGYDWMYPKFTGSDELYDSEMPLSDDDESICYMLDAYDCFMKGELCYV